MLCRPLPQEGRAEDGGPYRCQPQKRGGNSEGPRYYRDTRC